MTEERPMNLITRFLCAIGRHEYEEAYWYESRGQKYNHWVYVKTCICCNKSKIITNNS